MRRNVVWSTLYTREDIAKSGKELLSELVNAGAGKAVDPNLCMARIDGLISEPIWTIDAADIETLEVYVQRPARGAVTSINPRGTQRRPATPEQGCPQVFVWLRK